MKITLYTRAGCAHCRALRQWLKARGATFVEFDIQRSRRAARDFQRLGARGVPTLVVDGQVVHGFDERRLRKLLART